MKPTLLITGATGNVGMAVLRALSPHSQSLRIIAGVRNVLKDSPLVQPFGAETVHFDFEDPATYAPALAGVDRLFLLRPPQLSDVNRYFKPLIEAAKMAHVQHIVFLSVQGVENSSIIPHHKIEALLRQSGIGYTFLRPAYFMQNFTTTLRADLICNNRIFLPAGKAVFTLVDVSDVGKVAAAALQSPENHHNQAYDLTSGDALTFGEMAAALSNGLGRTITFVSPSLVQFFLTKRAEKVPVMLILVMIMLHYLPRFQQAPVVTDWVAQLTGEKARGFEAFIGERRQELS